MMITTSEDTLYYLMLWMLGAFALCRTVSFVSSSARRTHAFPRSSERMPPRYAQDLAPRGTTTHYTIHAPFPMDNGSLHEVLLQHFGDTLSRTSHGRWEATTDDGLKLHCMTDERADRMRFIIPVMPVQAAPKEFLVRILEANFHSALDARYAVSQGLVWSVFLHPLRSLGKEGARNALQQVVRLARTTGSSYSSSDLRFVGHVERDAALPVGRVTPEEAFQRAVAEGCGVAAEDTGGVPPAFCDPLTFEPMHDPVQLPSGHSCERSTIYEHIARFQNNPFTRESLSTESLVPNRALASAIADWRSSKSAKSS